MSRNEGFTLIELMIVVVIIGILAALGIPKYLNVSRGAKEAEAKPVLQEIRTLEERYKVREGDYTTDITLLEGGSLLPTGGKYFDYSVAAHATGFCAVATPNAAGTAAGLDPQSLDANGNAFQTATCS